MINRQPETSTVPRNKALALYLAEKRYASVTGRAARALEAAGISLKEEQVEKLIADGGRDSKLGSAALPAVQDDEVELDKSPEESLASRPEFDPELGLESEGSSEDVCEAAPDDLEERFRLYRSRLLS